MKHEEDTAISRDRLVAHIGTTRINIDTASANLEKLCQELGINLSQAQLVYHWLDIVKFHEGHLQTQISIFHALYDQEETP